MHFTLDSHSCEFRAIFRPEPVPSCAGGPLGELAAALPFLPRDQAGELLVSLTLAVCRFEGASPAPCRELFLSTARCWEAQR